ESDEEETRQEEEGSFDPIPRTPEGSEEESNDEEDQEMRLSEEARIQEEEKADELYRDVNINQGRGLQETQNVKDSHVTLTPVNPDGPQESSDVGVESIFTTASSSIVSLQTPTPIMTPSTIATITTSSEAPIPPPTIPSIILENLPTFNSAFRFDERLSDAGVESIFTTASSPIVSLQTPTPIMTPSTIATITTSSDAPIPPTIIPSIILENLPTFNSAFHFDERLRSLETTFSEYRQTNPFVDVVSAIPESTILKQRREDDIRKDPPLDQTGGLKDEENEVSMHQLALHLKQQPRVQADLPHGLNLDNCLPTTCQMEEPPHPVFETGADKLRQVRPLGSLSLRAETSAVLWVRS
nr:hypothetical protein [Tanacetum cinerariifolium]